MNWKLVFLLPFVLSTSCKPKSSNAILVGSSKKLLLLNRERVVERTKPIIKHYELKYNNDSTLQLPLLYVLIDANNDTTFIGLDIEKNSASTVYKLLKNKNSIIPDTSIISMNGKFIYTYGKKHKEERVIFDSDNTVVIFKKYKDLKNLSIKDNLKAWESRFIKD